MEGLAIEGRLDDIRGVAAELLRQSERAAAAGCLRQAQDLLAQVWAIASGHEPDLADTAAWNAAWLLVRTESYTEAAAWFGRVTAAPASDNQLWSATRQTMIRLCLDLARGTPDPAPPSPPATVTATPVAPAILPPLTVLSLGRFQLVRAGAVLPACKTRKAIAIFRNLLTRAHRAAHKDELAELFWPNAAPREALHSLHVAISALRRYLDPPAGSYLLFEAGYYRLNPAARIEDDSTRFRQLSDEGEHWWRAGDFERARQAYGDALACYQGDYYVDDADPISAVAERERLLARYLAVLDHLGQLSITQGRFEPAIECYRRLLERDGYREDAHGQLMRCYWQLGRRGEALRQYERCATILAGDLGLEPMPEIQALYRRIANAAPGSAIHAAADG